MQRHYVPRTFTSRKSLPDPEKQEVQSPDLAGDYLWIF